MKFTNKKLKIYALLGVVGGAMFMIGDCLIFCYEGLGSSGVQPLWVQMPEWRFVVSAILGFIGMALMLPAGVSVDRMIADRCGKISRILATLYLIGVASTGYLHFSLGSLMPLTYISVMSEGGTAELAANAVQRWSGYLAPLNFVLIGFLCIGYVLHFYVTVSGKSTLPRWFCLVGPVGAFALGMLWKVIFSGTAAEGAYGACESLGEGLIFLTAYFYHKKGTAEK